MNGADRTPCVPVGRIGASNQRWAGASPTAKSSFHDEGRSLMNVNRRSGGAVRMAANPLGGVGSVEAAS